jgi:hypothetical protein
MAPASRGVDDAVNALMAVGVGRGVGATTMAAERTPIGRGGRRQRSNHCRSDDHHRDDDVDYANCGAGLDDAPLDDGWRKRIRRTGNDA